MHYDVVVIGSGLAGLMAAYSASLASSSSEILVLSKDVTSASSFYAQGGIAAAVSGFDSPSLHAKDTIACGDEFCSTQAVDVLTNEGVERIKELISLGVPFDCDGNGVALGREAAHSVNRILHIGGDATGRKLTEFLYSLVKARKNVSFRNNSLAFSLLANGNQCNGVSFLDLSENESVAVFANAVILSTGGYAGLFSHTTNIGSRGSGVAMAFKAGAELMDLEFVQFHPTVFFDSNGVSFLISEAVRGEGAIIVDSAGKALMAEHPQCDLAPRDVVSRVIYAQLQKGERVFLDATSFPRGFFEKRFPTIYAKLSEAGLNPEKNLIPVSPAAHYSIGGVKTDVNCRTSIRGLYACGETACNGVHGANRLASNSLLEAIVFGARAGKNAVSESKKTIAAFNAFSALPALDLASTPLLDSLYAKLTQVLWRDAGIERSKSTLSRGLREITKLKQLSQFQPLSLANLEVQNSLLLAQLITSSAFEREESRGVHYRTDFPKKSEEWKKHLAYSKNNAPPKLVEIP